MMRHVFRWLTNLLWRVSNAMGDSDERGGQQVLYPCALRLSNWVFRTWGKR